MNIDIDQRLGGEMYRLEKVADNVKSSIKVSMPAIVKKVDYETMTISAQPAIKEKIKDENGILTDIIFPIIEDIPIVFLGSSKYCITFPISIDDECLLVFSDLCIDSWWQSSGIQTQFEYRRHDLSDCFAIISQMSQVKKINNINSKYLEIRNNVSGVKIELQDDIVNVAGVDVASLKSDFDQLLIDFNNLKQDYDSHTHSVSVNNGTSGPDTLSGSTSTPT